MSAPTTTNVLATAVNDAIKAALTGGSAAAEAALIADAPWLGLPIVKQLLEWFIGLIEQPLYENAAIVMTKIIIALQVAEETSAVNQAFKNAQQAIEAGDPNDIASASTALDNAFAALGNYDGSASP